MRARLSTTALLLAAISCAPTQPLQVTVPNVPQTPIQPSPAFTAPVDDLTTLIPADAAFVVDSPNPLSLATPEQKVVLLVMRGDLEKNVAGALSVDADALHDAIDDLERVTAFGDEKTQTVMLRFTGTAAAEALLKSKTLSPLEKESGAGRQVFAVERAKDVQVTWYAAAHMLVVGAGGARGVVEDLASHKKPSFASNDPKGDRHLPENPKALRVYGDLTAMERLALEAKGLVDVGSFVRGSLTPGAAGAASKGELRLKGARVPKLSEVFDKHPAALVARLPAETLSFVDVSTARRAGKTLTDYLHEMMRMMPEGVISIDDRQLDSQLKAQMGTSLADLDAMLGSEAILGAFQVPQKKAVPGLEGWTGFVVLESRDDAAVKRALGTWGKFLTKSAKDYRVTTGAGVLRFEAKKKGEPSIRVEALKGLLVLSGGDKAGMDRVTQSLGAGKDTFGDTPRYKADSALFAQPTSMLSWVAPTGPFALLGANNHPRVQTFLDTPPGGNGLGIRVDAADGGELAIFGALGAVGVYGVRRYLANSKTAEAKNVLGALGRSAVAAYEREVVTAGSLKPGATVVAQHALCGSSTVVPATVPSGAKYQPSGRDGADYQTGDQMTGWRCLKFEMSSPQYYQYVYRQGGQYKGPARGGPNPGPDGFEISAEGDLDGNGKTSLFTLTGTIDKKKQEVKISPEIFISDELE
jgi:hypothetical protein